MTDGYKWYYSSNEEEYQGEYDTREDAIDAGRDAYGERGFYIVEALRDDFDLSFDGESIIEIIDEANYERIDPDGDGRVFSRLTAEQIRGLGAYLNAAIQNWMRDFKVELEPCWAFKHQRNKEFFPGIKEVAP